VPVPVVSAAVVELVEGIAELSSSSNSKLAGNSLKQLQIGSRFCQAANILLFKVQNKNK